MDDYEFTEKYVKSLETTKAGANEESATADSQVVQFQIRSDGVPFTLNREKRQSILSSTFLAANA